MRTKKTKVGGVATQKPGRKPRRAGTASDVKKTRNCAVSQAARAKKTTFDVATGVGGPKRAAVHPAAEVAPEPVHPAVANLASIAWLVYRDVVPMSAVREFYVDGVTYSLMIEDGVAVIRGLPSVYEVNRMNLEGRDLEGKLARLRERLSAEELSRSRIDGAVAELARLRLLRDETPADAPSLRLGYEKEIALMEENLVGHEDWREQISDRILGIQGEISGFSSRLEVLSELVVPTMRVWRFGLGDVGFLVG
jgi:hypothetical protein